jgi:hypothetical protein
MHHVLQHAVDMRLELEMFLTEQRRNNECPTDAIWIALNNLVPVLATFKNAILELESDQFGSLSPVYEGMKMIRTAVGECFLDVLPDGAVIPAADLPARLPKKLYCDLNTFMQCPKSGWEKAVHDYWDT